jgi:cytochrome c oxidase subunit IV
MEHGDSSEVRKRPHAPSMRSYAAVWGSLVLLTAATVAVADLDLRKIAVVVCLGIAAAKSMLVLFFFMHLRYENRLIVKLIIPIAIGALAIFIGLTFSDILTR